jgi:hypothetical protein
MCRPLARWYYAGAEMGRVGCWGVERGKTAPGNAALLEYGRQWLNTSAYRPDRAERPSWLLRFALTFWEGLTNEADGATRGVIVAAGASRCDRRW